MKSANVVFMGTPDFAVASLEAMVSAEWRPSVVVTGVDKPRGRGQKWSPTPVKACALQHEIPVWEVDDVRDEAFADRLRNHAPDVLVVVAFRILPPAVYETARLGAFNLHGSLLPAYRGAAPIHHAVLNGDQETGVTTFLLQREVDAGEVLLQAPLSIGADETTGSVYTRMMHLGGQVVVQTLEGLVKGSLDPVPQDAAHATPAPKVFKSDGKLRPDETAIQTYNRIRAMTPWPGAWFTHEGTAVKINTARLTSPNLQGTTHEPFYHAAPGTVTVQKGRLWFHAADGPVELTQVTPAGKRPMPGGSFPL